MRVQYNGEVSGAGDSLLQGVGNLLLQAFYHPPATAHSQSLCQHPPTLEISLSSRRAVRMAPSLPAFTPTIYPASSSCVLSAQAHTLEISLSSRRAARMAASFIRFARSAPVKPGVRRAIFSKSTSLPRVLPRECT